MNINDVSSSSKMSSSNRPALKEGEWACVDAKCAQVNSDKRRHCQKCGKGFLYTIKHQDNFYLDIEPIQINHVPNKKLGEKLAKRRRKNRKDYSQRRIGCGNVNWARRIMCNVCNAPKLADLEVRTGYGGGYMDREDVEYIQREDNEEFDEFGRKKRRKKVGGFAETKGIEENFDEEKEDDEEREDEEEEEQVGTEHEEEQEEDKEAEEGKEEKMDEEEGEEGEEEDDDDGDEADLDKYDLSADPELASLTIDLLKRRTQGGGIAVANSMADNGKRSQSVASSDCSCSCSGGECSCEDSEQEKEVAEAVKRPKMLEEAEQDVKRLPQEKERSERREHDRSGHRHRERARSRESSGRSARSREREAARDREVAREREGRRGETKEQRHQRRDHRQDSREREEKGREERIGARRRSRDR